MSASDPSPLVSTAWLEERLGAPDIRILDGSLYLPGDPRDAHALYEKAHIPGARFFDIEEISDARSDLPHMLPPVEKFVARVRRMGIGDGHRVVAYDQQGLFSAARVWWMFRVFGHSDVSVLDGGLPKWLAEGRPVEDEAPEPRERHFTGRKNASMVRDVTQIAGHAKLRDEQIVDARSPGRFRGEEAEPRPGLRAGHIPGSKNVHYRSLLEDDGTMKPVAETRAIFEAAGVDLSKPVVTTCGSGITAAILTLALHRMGHGRNALYDGSWAEWGSYPDLAVEKG
ncbi:3-mercaptopyruvate sulfurtransferase [Limibaculum sp. FT325]|uniref:3-mercaptopyruvate sulfurtransferase n=1 Tax=Thermohalobaculum sediminis TaxID=2939436 RepID=UPI0020C14E58|nr:3-mercaptopyruvate sulfurtransferase [Limibaculum sediminis]MCL5777431.1 3-mercaptopyruvate sulfurtransferase [Limibaculum sediminis]